MLCYTKVNQNMINMEIYGIHVIESTGANFKVETTSRPVSLQMAAVTADCNRLTFACTVKLGSMRNPDFTMADS